MENQVVELVVTVLSHRGVVRDHNEDAIGVDGWALQGDTPGSLQFKVTVDRPYVIAVCDGMGGHNGGEFASRWAAEKITLESTVADIEALTKEVSDRTQSAADYLVRHSQSDQNLQGMGTTAVTLAVLPNAEATVIHVGDSRAYLIEDGALAALTRDDRRDANSSVLTQALGGGRLVELDVHNLEMRLRKQNRVLLCSDGLVDMVDDALISELVAGDALQSVDALIKAACDAGGRDNITIALIDVVQVPDVPEAAGFIEI